ncbi:MAG: tetratricopeptide repeat protein [Actinobacteria bacterium]|nr:tetratricopeptide repeat protein [Actinomycetota bacterium]
MNSGNAYDLFMEGKKLAGKNEHLKAIMLFEKATALEPAKGSIREALGLSYYNCGFYDSAKKHFEKALEIDLANDFVHFCMGLCLAKEGRLSASLGHLKIAWAMKPSNTRYSKAVEKYSLLFDKFK